MNFSFLFLYKSLRLCPDDRPRTCEKKPIDEREDPKKYKCCVQHTHWKIAFKPGERYW